MKKKVETIKVGECVGTPGDRKVRIVWGVVSKIEKDDGLVIFSSPDWAVETTRKYRGPNATGSYIARRGESLTVGTAASCAVKKRA